jgi:UDP-glucose 4-epimerase
METDWKFIVNSKPRILVTGASGYIGSHLVTHLFNSGKYEVHGIIKYGENEVEKYLHKKIYGDITTDSLLYHLYRNNYDAIVHLAAKVSVAESVKSPSLYYKTNVEGTMNLISTINPKNLIFASTAAAFDPVSPYALSKIMCENIIRERCNNYTIFRFFNVAGSDGTNHQVGPATHLIRVAAEAAARKRDQLHLYGIDYNTPDGTCLRDYVHVLDLVDAIEKAIYNPKNTPYECLGTGKTYSCREVINTMNKVSGKTINVIESPRRAGDAPVLCIPNGQKSDFIECKRTLEDMCSSAYHVELL